MINKVKTLGLWVILISMIVAGCDRFGRKGDDVRADQLLEAAYQARNYKALMLLTDSLEQEGAISLTKAYYWRGYASDRMKHFRMAEFYWKASLDAAEGSTNDTDLDIYAKTASRLANLLSVRGDYEGTLKMALPAAQWLEEHNYTSTADYVNLLIYIGCCQAAVGNSGDAEDDGFERAYQKHLENVDKNHNQTAYKNAIAGLTNIAYYCIDAEKFQDALKWTERYGKLLGDYEQLQGVSASYVDKQLARFYIYQAEALEGLERSDEAAKVYENFMQTRFSHTPEGRIMANDYLMVANRWDEAADNYESLDTMLTTQGGYSMDNIRDMLLKKYHSNLIAGRKDTAALVSMQICDSLEHALALAKRLDAEEQATIVDTVEQITAHHVAEARQWQLIALATLGVVFLGFIAYFVHRHRSNKKLEKAHGELKTAYDQLEQNTSARERQETELRIARDIQQSVLPPGIMASDDFMLMAMLKPGTDAGGDFYDYFVRDQKLFFCLGSVQGRNMQRSTMVAMIVAQFRAAGELETNPARLMMALNRVMADDGHDGTTVFVGVLDLATGKLHFCNAGHTTPLLTASDSLNQVLVEANVPLGKVSDWAYKPQELTIHRNSMLFTYTSGLTTAENAEQQPYGERRMLGSALQAMKMSKSPEQYLESMEAALEHFTAGQALKDDCTMLVVQYRK